MVTFTQCVIKQSWCWSCKAQTNCRKSPSYSSHIWTIILVLQVLAQDWVKSSHKRSRLRWKRQQLHNMIVLEVSVRISTGSLLPIFTKGWGYHPLTDIHVKSWVKLLASNVQISFLIWSLVQGKIHSSSNYHRNNYVTLRKHWLKHASPSAMCFTHSNLFNFCSIR